MQIFFVEENFGSVVVNNVTVTLKVFDILGREFAELLNEEKSPGTHEVKLVDNNLIGSIYSYRLVAGNFLKTKN